MSADPRVEERGTSVSKAVLRIVSGNPTPEELAVLTAVVTAAGSRGGGAGRVREPVRRGGWGDPAWQHRGAWLPGPGAWRAAVR